MSKNWIYWILFVVILCGFIIGCTSMAKAEESEEPVWTNKMIALHEAADNLRALGYSEDSEVIKALSAAWWSEYNDFCIIAKVIEGEAGGCDNYTQLVYTGVTVVNRVKSSYFADTVYDVVASPGQYTTAYLKNFHTIQRRCWLAAKDAMDGNHDAPDDLYWEALFPQGRETWKIIHFESKYYKSDTYFCCGTIYD